MRDTGHIHTSEDIKSILKEEDTFEELNMDDPKVLLQYYRDNYSAVEFVSCDACGSPLCLWIHEPKQVAANASAHPQGFRRITIGSSLLSTRLRLDNEVGYHCKCGNTSIINAAEKGIVPQAHYNSNGELLNPEVSLDLQPHHVAAYATRVSQKNWKTKKTHRSPTQTSIDNFTTEKVK